MYVSKGTRPSSREERFTVRQTMIAVLLLLTWGGFKSLSFAQYQSQRRFATASNGTNLVKTQSIRLPGFVIHSPTSAEQMRKRLDAIIDSEPRLKTSPRVAIVDYSLPIDRPRFFVYDSRARTVLYSTYVGHSSYSGEDIPTKFSNVPQSKKTSLGLYRVGVEYRGKFGRSKKLHGLSASNSNAFKRGIVIHSMPDGAPSYLYSWGCLTFFERDLSEAFTWLTRSSYVIVVS